MKEGCVFCAAALDQSGSEKTLRGTVNSLTLKFGPNSLDVSAAGHSHRWDLTDCTAKKDGGDLCVIGTDRGGIRWTIAFCLTDSILCDENGES